MTGVTRECESPDAEVVPVVVIGAGPTGVTAATLLGQYGVRTLVLDRWADVYPQPRAVHLDDEVYRILARLGVDDAFAQISRPALGLRLVDRDLRVLAEFRRSDVAGVNGHPQANMFDQPELEALLRANLHRYPCVTLRGGVDVVGIEATPAGTVVVDYREHDTGEHRTATAQYLLGCDGANSRIRDWIGSDMRNLGFEQRWLVVDVATDTDLGLWDGVHQVCDPRRPATFMRVGPTRYRWEFRLNPGEQAADYAALTTLQPILRPWTGDTPPDLLRVLRVAEYTFRAQVADRWRRDQVFLLGDAAHLTPPFIGQGMGAGLRDAYNLAWKLAGVLHDALPAAVLDSYETERKPHARAMIRLATYVGHAMTGGNDAADRIRRLLVPRLHRVPGLRTHILDSTTPRLRRSSLVNRHVRGHLAGMLCPNLPLGDGRHVDDLPPTFLLLTTRPLTMAERQALDACGVRHLVVLPSGNLGTWLRRGRSAAALLRPDRTIMIAGTDVSRICTDIATRPIGGHLDRPASVGQRPATDRRTCAPEDQSA
ncbi:bifunctional 3-(3-hydroxy-phenyl)propionate/3-hydroxycinnamic acid hydroxylase [Frankia sp. CNm7]|uniref:Bifunctional 3-(3-hydroxy-phenyl)propionate/3-hydroxycinnamic acid hydroxylase n=1 Tax=Frankia nepalensis TaxID=1836974 RepID=A0A937RX43_9ACTN|nr:bifunctional 3-(3-hydroxy-phenyl)propionate/3-hydroxycinnamic acid hydroxylase [Frankia nepalensis]MBL7501963.1 bifunctional 3-(3-hydroxy-phenyl)propionate/3-hydroxycinnamic acid hydroxylase [Frankia nepalensis]MBL7510593.1 bifunctional 3-(3-hydroxy-phenyl)propionate/3-hydroxycinnamic acid hydroxylase [Frankia nepalensis]MBL7517333.1 bifunctional 3-(3-hydroxy-phenyl)propionate/3-hydroxycinnamic acid hydroxylase [Frankia nepalensis]MBL7633416.1 bifunctional 3-(3-hydroxy-phenyl)propionate/3-hy